MRAPNEEIASLYPDNGEGWMETQPSGGSMV